MRTIPPLFSTYDTIHGVNLKIVELIFIKTFGVVIWSFGVVREHPTDFFAGAEAYYVAYKGVDISEWVMPVDGTVRYAPGTSKGVVAVRVDDGI